MCIIELGRADEVDGGVVGMKRDFGMAAVAGEGEVARYRSKSAPSASPFGFVPGRRGLSIRRGGVLGGLEWKVGCC